jgi:ribosomal protein S27E
MEASVSRVFMNEQMHWTLQATCSACLHETVAPLNMGVPIHCVGCSRVITIEPGRTIFRRCEGTGYARDPIAHDASLGRS